MSPSSSLYLFLLFIQLHVHLLFSHLFFFSSCLIEMFFSQPEICVFLTVWLRLPPFLLLCIHGPHGVWAEAFVAFHALPFLNDEQPIQIWFFPPEQGEWILPGAPYFLFGWISSRSTSCLSTEGSRDSGVP